MFDAPPPHDENQTPDPDVLQQIALQVNTALCARHAEQSPAPRAPFHRRPRGADIPRLRRALHRLMHREDPIDGDYRDDLADLELLLDDIEERDAII